MTLKHSAVTVAVPGDLHLTTRDQPNFVAAQTVLREIRELIQPDFVQFIGDNVQDAKESQFVLFNELRSGLGRDHFALVGDHDLCRDHGLDPFRRWIGEPHRASLVSGIRFLRLNTLDGASPGLSNEQLDWLQSEFEGARTRHEQVVIFQHHYPYKVCENFSGPGVDRWAALVEQFRPVAVICGHTHYFQIANNGRVVSVATRSIGDPEGGPPGYLVVHVLQDDLALRYRAIDDAGPFVLITHPRDIPLATTARHIVASSDQIRVRVWSTDTIDSVSAWLNERCLGELQPEGAGRWVGPLDSHGLAKGEHTIRVSATSADGTTGQHEITFRFDPTGRFTAVPCAVPTVMTTAFC